MTLLNQKMKDGKALADTLVEKKTEPKKGPETSELENLLQRQVNHEFDNERLYLSMALWCEENGYTETAAFFSDHTLEERKHGMDFINFMTQRKMKVLSPVPATSKREYTDIEEILQESVSREVQTSKMISEIHKEALKTGDLALTITNKYLQEQVEEEQLFNSLLNLYKSCAGSKVDFEMEVGLLKTSDKYKIGTL